jgi:hypothetical protein
MLPGNGKCLTIAYSSSWNNQTIRTIASEYYIAARSVGNMIIYSDAQGPYFHNSYVPSLINPSLDPLASPGMFSLFKSAIYNNDAIDAIIRCGGWLHVYTHGIEPADSAKFVPYCDYIFSKRDSLWCGTVRDVARYIYEREASVVQVVSANTSQVVLDLTHSLDTTLCYFEYPLTLKTEVPSAWDSVLIEQGGNSQGALAVDESGTQYVYYDAVPNAGQITLSPGWPVTAVRYGRLPSRARGIKDPGLVVCSSPVRVGSFLRYLKTTSPAAVRDLSGKPVEMTRQLSAGVYLLQTHPGGKWERLIVTE